MAKRINPTILRIGIKNEWQFKYIEKKNTEFKTYSFKSSEINEFIQKIFIYNGLNIFFSRLFFNRNSLHIFITYDYYTSNNFFHFNKINFLLKTKKSLVYLIKLVNIYNVLKLKRYLKKKYFKINLKLTKIKNFTNYAKINLNSEFRRLNLLKFLSFLKLKHKTLKNYSYTNRFFKKFIVSLNNFLENKTSLFITVKQILKNNFIKNFNKKNKKNFVLNLLKLRKFEKNEFFKQTINLIFKSKKLTNKAYMLSEFLKFKLEQIKKPKLFNFFFFFIKNTLKYFLLKTNNIKGLKIIFKGNLAKKTRAVKKVIKIGENISNSKINYNLNYHNSICHTKKGAFGIKIFIV